MSTVPADYSPDDDEISATITAMLASWSVDEIRQLIEEMESKMQTLH